MKLLQNYQTGKLVKVPAKGILKTSKHPFPLGRVLLRVLLSKDRLVFPRCLMFENFTTSTDSLRRYLS